MTLRLKVKPLMVFGALEAASLGLGVAFVLLGWPLVRRVAAPDKMLIAAGAALAWCFATTDWDRSARRAAAP